MSRQNIVIIVLVAIIALLLFNGYGDRRFAYHRWVPASVTHHRVVPYGARGMRGVIRRNCDDGYRTINPNTGRRSCFVPD